MAFLITIFFEMERIHTWERSYESMLCKEHRLKAISDMKTYMVSVKENYMSMPTVILY